MKTQDEDMSITLFPNRLSIGGGLVYALMLDSSWHFEVE
jgi:hypothetical protein